MSIYSQVLRPSKRKDDVVLAITTTGTVKVWTLLGNENKHSEPIYENESKEVRYFAIIPPHVI